MGNRDIRWRLQLRVLPESAPPFDAMVHALLPQSNRPRPRRRPLIPWTGSSGWLRCRTEA